MIFFDNNATTKMEPSVHQAMLRFFSSEMSAANPSSVHRLGRIAKAAIDEASEVIATRFGIPSFEDIVYTSGASESINLAVKGAFFQAKQRQKRFHLITSTVEHSATLKAAEFIQSLGAIIHKIPVDIHGQLRLSQLMHILSMIRMDKNNEVLASFIIANNETGVVFDYQRIGSICSQFEVPLHIDVVQTPRRLPQFMQIIQVTEAALASYSGHKFGGPKGVGFLYCKKGTKLVSLIDGGPQQRKRRAGTVNVAAIIGMAEAAKLLGMTDYQKQSVLTQSFERQLERLIPEAIIVGQNSPRLVNTTNIMVPGAKSDSMVIALDLANIAASAGSACSSGSITFSPIVHAMGYSERQAASVVRFSLGPENTLEEVDQVVESFVAIVRRILAKPSKFETLSKRPLAQSSNRS